MILIPERPFDLEQVHEQVNSRFEINYAPIVVVAEGAVPKEGQMILKDQSLDEFGHVRLSGIGEWLARELSQRTGKEARTTVLGHIQRGGTPSAFDRWLATRFGLHAIDAVKDGDFGAMVALQHPHRPHPPVRGHSAAQAGRSGALRRSTGVLRLTGPRPRHAPCRFSVMRHDSHRTAGVLQYRARDGPQPAFG